MNDREQLHRYAALIESALPPPGPFVAEPGGPESAPKPAATSESAQSDPRGRCTAAIAQEEERAPSVVQVERGAVLAQVLRGAAPVDLSSYIDRLIERVPGRNRPIPDVVDRRGHRRPVYRALLTYAWVKSFQLLSQNQTEAGTITPPENRRGRVGLPTRNGSAETPTQDVLLLSWAMPLLDWCPALEIDATLTHFTISNLAAANGSAVSSTCWAALALYCAGETFGVDSWSALAQARFAALAAAQQPAGTFLLTSAKDNPETHWYHELVILHAAASFAAQSGDPAVTAAVSRSADYHLAEIQPDHATGQPWGLPAFILNEQCRPLADELLHTLTAQAAGGRSDEVSSILLADALYCVRVHVGDHTHMEQSS